MWRTAGIVDCTATGIFPVLRISSAYEKGTQLASRGPVAQYIWRVLAVRAQAAGMALGVIECDRWGDGVMHATGAKQPPRPV